MKKITLLLLIVTSISFAQDLNQYKYVLVPAKFSFLKEKNQYNLNLLSKMYMQQFGFETFFDTDEVPKDFLENNCNKIYFDVLEDNNMFATKLTVVLKDCKGKVLFTSKEGINKEKEYKVSYNLALREAFNSMKSIQYKYSGNTDIDEVLIEEEPVKEANNETPLKHNPNDWTYIVKKEKNGYLITDSANPKFFLQLFKTDNPIIYIGKSDRGNGVATIKKDYLTYEYYEDVMLISMMVNVNLQ